MKRQIKKKMNKNKNENITIFLQNVGETKSIEQ